jgi:hypothetical protein
MKELDIDFTTEILELRCQIPSYAVMPTQRNHQNVLDVNFVVGSLQFLL